MNPYFAAMLACAGMAILLITVGPSLLPIGTQRSLAALLIGLMAGFVTNPLPMLMLPAFAIGVVLAMNRVREGRLRDVGLLLTGAGSVWTALWVGTPGTRPRIRRSSAAMPACFSLWASRCWSVGLA